MQLMSAIPLKQLVAIGGVDEAKLAKPRESSDLAKEEIVRLTALMGNSEVQMTKEKQRQVASLGAARQF